MAKREITLTDHFEHFIDDAVAAGQYADADELVREALRLLEQRKREDELKLQRLREAVGAGFAAIDRGEYRQFSVDDIDDVIAELGERAAGLVRKTG